MAANNTIDESIALITAANTVVQDPEAVGTAFKTISMRIRGAKTELEEAGLETEGMVESTAKLRSEILALSGVDIMLNENEFKSTYQIMDELAEKWEDLSDIQQATITELIAGKRQGNIVSSLMTNFDTAREALDTSMNSAGSAMKEHEKWQKSLEAQLNKLKASWQALSQAFLKSDFLKFALDAIIDLVDGLTKLIDKVGALPVLIGVFAGLKVVPNLFGKIGATAKAAGGGIKSFSDVLALLQLSFPKVTELIGKFIASLKKSEDGSRGFTKSLKGIFDALKQHWIIAVVVAAITVLTAVIGYQSKQAEKLSEKVEELTDKYREQHEELKKIKDDYDTSNESSMISKYEKLSKGVDNLGRNVSLTADEYSEYQDIVNQIAEQFPSLVAGYDEQGNALLTVKGNVEQLTEAYEKLIHAQNQDILTKTGDIEKDFKNTLDKTSGKQWWSDGHGFWEGLFVNGATLSENVGLGSVDFINQVGKRMFDYELKTDTAQAIQDLVNARSEKEKKNILRNLKLDEYAEEEIRDLLPSMGYDVGYFESPYKVLEEALEKDPAKLQEAVNNYYAQFAEVVEKEKTIATAKLSEAFDVSSAISGLDYGNISEDLQAIAYQTVNSLDLKFFEGLQKQGKTVEQWTTEMLDQLNSISKADNAQIEAALDLQTQFNGGEISYGEYVDGLKGAGDLIERLNLKPELESQLKLSLGLDEDGFVAEYKQLKNRLADDDLFNIKTSEYESFLKGLSAEELSVLIDIIPELSETDYKETIGDVKAALEKEMMLQGLTFDLNLEVEATGLEALNTALAESVSATGLSSESITALKGRYADLESQGYDLSSMFEETSTGIRLNRQEFNKLENAYATDKLAEVDSELTEMKLAYDDLGEAIKNCDDPVKKSELFNDRQTLAKRISEAATLAHQYKGLTSAYNDWLSAEEAGQERDMYENVIKGLETVDDEIARGWIDDGTIEFLELLTGRTDLAGKSGKQLKEIYDGLDDTIKNTGYSIRDFFTVDEDGNSTNTGVYNFLDAIGQLEEEKFGGKDVVKRDKDGNIIGFNFELAGGDEVIAEALGVSEELVQIMVRAADDAGFVVSMDGTYKQLADLQNEARAAADYLHKIGKTDFEFDFNTTSVENLKTQLEEAHKILDDKKFWNKDGTFNFNADGATQAMQVVSTLQAKLDKLTQEQYGIGLTVEDEEFEEPLENLQEYGRTIQTLNQLRLNPEVNAEEIDECETKLDELAQEFNELDTEKKLKIGLEIEKGVALTQENLDKLTDEKKIKLGFVDDDGKPLTNVVDVIQNKIESGEVTIPTVLDIQTNMDKNIETLADLALLNSGLLSESEEEVIRKKYKVEVETEVEDTSDTDDNAFVGTATVGFGGLFKSTEILTPREANIQVIAETMGVEDVEALETNLEKLDDKTIQAIAKVLGQTDVDLLKDTIGKLKPTEVEAIAKAIGQGDVEGLKTAIYQLSPKHVEAIAEAFGYDDVNSLIGAIDNLDPKTVEAVANALGITDVESLQSAVDNMQGNTVDAKVNTDGQAEKVWTLQDVIDGLKGKVVDIVVNTTEKVKKVVDTVASAGKKVLKKRFGIGGANGTANADGTAFADGVTGRAYKQGSWGTKNSGAALVGELGTEVLVRDGRYYTIGDNGAEFIKYKKGDIIFNHRQTEELFANGRVASGGGRGKAFADGTAFSRGSGGIGKVVAAVKDSGGKTTTKTTTKKKKDTTTTTTTTTTNSGGSSGSGGGTGKVKGSAVGKDAFEESFDWIAVAIERVEREIGNLDKRVNNTYKSWVERNAALKSEIAKVSDEITLQENAAAQYLEKANSVEGVSAEYRMKIYNGTLDIDTITDEDTAEKIKEYQKWYELYLSCKDKAEELKQTESELYAQRFENIQSTYDGILQGFEHTESMLNEYISQAEAKGHIVSKEYYQALISNEKSNIKALEQEQAALIQARDEAVANGKVEKYSEEWYNMCAEIDGVTQAIEEGKTALIEYDNAMRDIDWQVFDLMQERISDVAAESNFLIDLMSYDKLFDDNGKLTDKGMATMGLHGQNINTYMYQADDYAKEISKLDSQIAQDPYDQELINRRRELIELQRESILAAEDEKQAIKDLVEEGINLELDALQERIDLHNEELNSMKDLYDYQKNVEEQTKNIASLQKQLHAYEGFDDEETRATVQKLKVELESAQQDLQETEYDKYIADQTALLDELFLEYENVLNTRLDDTNGLIAQVIDAVNIAAGAEGTIATALGAEGAIAKELAANGITIKSTLETEAKNVGTTLSTAMKGIWSVDEGNAKSVITEYGKGFQDKQTTTNAVLGDIKAYINRMVDDVDKDAQKKVAANKTSTSAKKDPTKNDNSSNKTSSSGTNSNKSTGGDGKVKIGDKVKFLSGKYYYDSQGVNPAGSKNHGKEVYITNINTKSWATHPYHISTGKKLGSGDLGWLKLNQISGYATGKKNFLNNEIAWTQEDGQELIVRPSDGAILTPIAKGDSVLTSAASSNLWNMANSPAEFIKDNLNLGAADVPSNSNVQNNITQHLDKVVFNLPNVKNYEQLLSEMQKDKNFEKLILSMTIDQIAGKSSLAKGKSIR